VAWRYRAGLAEEHWKLSATPVYADPAWRIEQQPLFAHPTPASAPGDDGDEDPPHPTPALVQAMERYRDRYGATPADPRDEALREAREALAGALSHCGSGGYLNCGKPATDGLRQALAKINAVMAGGEG